MDQTLSKAKAYMQAGDYSRAIVLLQRARNLCECITAFQEKYKTKEHSSAKACLRDTLLSAALDEDDEEAVYKAATSSCPCGVPKLACDESAHIDALDKMAACSAAMGKSEAAVGFAVAAIHLDPKSPVGYCRLSKLIRTRSLDAGTLRADIDNEVLALGIVRHGVFNVKTHGDVDHPLYKVLQVISKKLYRKDPLKVFPPELKVMILSYLDTLELVRCLRVSKRWLFAIRDDPNLWKKLLLVFNGKKSKSDRMAKGMLKIISRSRKASTLSVAPAIFDAAQYNLIFSRLKDLRHLHLDCDSPIMLDQPCPEPPRQLTRFTCFMFLGLDRNLWFRSILEASASTLEELQVRGRAEDITSYPLPNLRVLRYKSYLGGLHYRQHNDLLSLDLLRVRTPRLEQLCLEGALHAVSVRDLATHEDTVIFMWPKLKVLIISRDVSLRLDPRDALISPGIRVIDAVNRGPRNGASTLTDSLPDSVELTSLQYFRLWDSEVDPQELGRVLGPSLANGNLKTLSLTWGLEGLHQLPLKSEHVQALGLSVDDFPKGHLVAPAYMNWVAKFPNAHTFSVDASPDQLSAALAPLMLRSGTKRIFDNRLNGVRRDEFVEEGKARNIEIIGAEGFPIIFPWRFDDDTDSRGDGDVVEQWKNARGRLPASFDGDPRISKQPFFLE